MQRPANSKCQRISAGPFRQLRTIGLALIFAAIIGPGLAAKEKPVDLELLLAADVSGSVDAEEARLQRNGYLGALRNPEVIAAIKSGMLGRIALSYVEWAGLGWYKVIVDWTEIHDEASAAAFAAKLAAAPIVTAHRTSVSDAIDLSVPRFTGNGFEGTRRILDVSGDGSNNYGRLVTDARDDAVAAGITVNGLPIVTDQTNAKYPTIPNIDLFYRDCVIGGPGAFHVVADGFEDFDRAVRKKLILEIANRVPTGSRHAAAPAHFGAARLWRVADRVSPPCNIGEWRWLGIITGGTGE